MWCLQHCIVRHVISSLLPGGNAATALKIEQRRAELGWGWNAPAEEEFAHVVAPRGLDQILPVLKYKGRVVINMHNQILFTFKLF